MSEATTTKKKPIIDVFLGGAKRGFYIGVETVLPSMILGYVIMQFLTLTGLMDVLAIVCAPIMRLFGLPGEAAAVLFSAFFSKAAGAAAAASLFGEGVLTAAQCTILIIPCMLMGTLVGHFSRIVLVCGVEPKRQPLMLAVPIVDSTAYFIGKHYNTQCSCFLRRKYDESNTVWGTVYHPSGIRVRRFRRRGNEGEGIYDVCHNGYLPGPVYDPCDSRGYLHNR